MFAHKNLPAFDYNKLIHDCKLYANANYRDCIEQPQIRQLAEIVVASAARLGVHDANEIYALVLKIVASPYYDVFSPMNSQSDSAKDAEVLTHYQMKLTRLVNIFRNCNVDHLLSHFIKEKRIGKRSELMSRLNELSVWDTHYQDIPDWISIYQLLTDDKLVATYLDSLEQALQKNIAEFTNEWQFPLNTDGKHVLPAHKDKPFLCYKLLSNFLYQWGIENGFQQSAKIIRSLDAKAFYSLLASQSLMKDSGIVAGHGIFTHAVQWYVVIEHHKKSAFLKNVPLDIYKRLGDTSLTHYSKTEETKPWDILFDSFTSNFTSPENLSDYIKSDKARWPLLAETFTRQAAKIESAFIEKLLLTKHAREINGGVVVRQFKSKL